MNPDTQLQNEVKEAYSRIALAPAQDPPFPTGLDLARGVGYSDSALDSIPDVSVEAFCGVANVSQFARIGTDDVVLDLGCGAGLDTILSARRAAKVVAVDFSVPMLLRTQRAVAAAGLEAKVTLLRAEAQHLPLLEASIDVAIVNGIFNLNPVRQQIFEELARVIRPGGCLYAAELILKEPLPDSEKADNWFT